MKHQKSNSQTSNLLYGWLRCISRPILDVLGHIEFHGSENVPKQGGVVLVSNHLSYVDPVMIAAATTRELHFFGAEEFFRIPGFGWLLEKLNGFPVNRGTPDRQALKEALSRLRAGEALLIFPEGTRSTDRTLGKMHNGASFIIHHTGVPTIPVFLKGAERFMPRGSKFIHPTKLSVTFGSPIDFTALRKANKKQELYQQMTEQIRQAILALRKH